MYYVNSYIEWQQKITEAYFFPELKNGNHKLLKLKNITDNRNEIKIVIHEFGEYISYCIMIPFSSMEEYKTIIFELTKNLFKEISTTVVKSKDLMPKRINETGYNLTILVSNFNEAPLVSNFKRSSFRPSGEVSHIDDLLCFIEKLRFVNNWEENFSDFLLEGIKMFNTYKPAKKRKTKKEVNLNIPLF